MRYVTGNFLDFTDPTIEDLYRVERTVDGQSAWLVLADPVGDDLPSAIRDLATREASAFLIGVA